MKKIFFILLTIFSFAFVTITTIFDSLEITKEKAKELLLGSIASGGMQKDGDIVSKARSLPVEMRVAGIKELMYLAKEYSQSEEFKKDYKKWRNARLNPEEKNKLGIPKFGRMLNNKIDNALDKSKNEKEFPSDPQLLVKQRLEDFLRISATVDFDAEVQDGSFVKEQYEKKSNDWKMCYRAGREVVEAAREVADEWLNEFK